MAFQMIMSRTLRKKKQLHPFSFECRETNEINLPNHKGGRQSGEPIKTHSKYVWLIKSAGNPVQASYDWLTTGSRRVTFISCDW